MIKREEVSIRTSCLNKADDDEPIFVLRAHDPLAALAVRLWANRYRTRKTENGRRMDLREELKFEEAIVLADLMDSWRQEHDYAAQAVSRNDEDGEARGS